MKDIVLCLMLLLTISVIGLRINIQFSAIKQLKENSILKKIGIDTILFFIPEFIPIKSFRKELGNNITEQIELYFRKIKIYRILLLTVIILFCFAFFLSIK